MADLKDSSATARFLRKHEQKFINLPRNKANLYLQAHNFSEFEKKTLKRVRRNHQNKICSQNYRSSFKEKIESLEKENLELVLKLKQCLKENKALKRNGHLHWKKKMLQTV